MQILKTSLFPDLNGLSKPQRQRALDSFTNMKRVVMQTEYRRPPLKLTHPVVRNMLSEYTKAKANSSPPPESVKRAYENPKRFKDTPVKEKNYEPVKEHYNFRKGSRIPTELCDTAEESIVERLIIEKEYVETTERTAFQYFLPSPFSIDAQMFYEKMITYFLNPAHEGKVIGKSKKGKILKSSSGGDKHVLFYRHLGFNNTDPESLNKCYSWFADELYNYETTLQKVKFTPHGIQASYLSAFMAKNKEGEDVVMYVRHVWQSDYYKLEEEDINILKKKGLFKDYHNAEEGAIDGWAKFVTGFIAKEHDLNEEDMEFVNRKYKNKEKAVILATTSPEISRNDWQINGNLTIGQNWTDAIPSKVDFSKKPLLVKQPSSYYTWDPNNYPSVQNNIEFVKTPPAGEWYGFIQE